MHKLLIGMMLIVWGCDDDTAPIEEGNKLPGVATSQSPAVPTPMFAGAMAPDPAQGGFASVSPEAQASMGGQANESDDQDRMGEQDQPDDSEQGGVPAPSAGVVL